MWHPCCQNVLGEKALKSIIWQQYLLSRGGKQTAAPLRSDTHRDSNSLPLISEAHIYVRCCLFPTHDWVRICHLWHRVKTVLILSLKPGFKSKYNTQLDCNALFLQREQCVFCEKVKTVQIGGGISLYYVITKPELSTHWCFLSSLLAQCLIQQNIQGAKT